MERTVFFLLLFVAASCGGGQAQRSASASAPAAAAGGELRVEEMPAAAVQIRDEALVVWGSTEVPAGSRLQAAKALVDAATRAELAKFLRVKVTSLQLDIEEAVAAETRQRILVKTEEIARVRLGASAPIQHGWRQVERQEGAVLELVGRLEVGRETLAAALGSTLEPSDAGHLPAILNHLFTE